MAASGAGGRRRARRSTMVSRRLAAARERHVEQLAQQRENERNVDSALEVYFLADEKIAEAEQECERRTAPHELAIARLHERRDVVVEQHRAEQGRAALAAAEADRTGEQIATLFGVDEKTARRLIAAGRDERKSTVEAGEPPVLTGLAPGPADPAAAATLA
ncbi:hypothetical protein [Lentzea kentuckyensis]|uniref:hypothetical protein n=1 Tax=Lentzea kentuckyensis TaxID=360086 RepID=UPI00117A2968|nr:hypothetical protein [Lentzea kentuckyensis]